MTNLILIGLCSTLLGLQRLLFGSLRPAEIEQLYEKSWYAVTETCLAMTIFRDEVGGWFLVMFVSLLIGKVWGWIGEGRVEILEQQPPANPRLFHVRLSSSLILSSLFEILMFRYSVQTVLLQARPNMMVMFAFEFAVLTVTSLSTAARYLISLHESSIIRHQISRRRAQLDQSLQTSLAGGPESESSSALPLVESQQENFDGANNNIDMDAPGWEDKGRWIFYLDLMTGMALYSNSGRISYYLSDFCKLVLYLTFFSVLCMFYGMPIHIIRDVAITVRSFYKRISDFIRYRQATKDMKTRYPDATAEEIQREDVCIICREVMHASRQFHEVTGPRNNQSRPEVNDHVGSRNNNINSATIAGDERLRPKKLPCGHILHCACLRSWLERQQICPTCRAPVLVSNPAGSRSIADNRTRDMTSQNNRQHGNNETGATGPRRNIGRNTVNFGPFRLSFGVREDVPRDLNSLVEADLRRAAQPRIELQEINTSERPSQASPTRERDRTNVSSYSSQDQLLQLEQQLIRDIHSLGRHAAQLFFVRMLENELARLRLELDHEAITPIERPAVIQPFTTELIQRLQLPSSMQTPNWTDEHLNLASGQQALPSGMILPHGWNVLPLRRFEVERENASATFYQIPNNINSEDSVTHAGLQPTFQSTASAGNYQHMKEEDNTPETETSHGRSRADLLSSGSRADIPHSFADKRDPGIQLLRRWDEEGVAQNIISQGPVTSKSNSYRGPEAVPDEASPDPTSVIGSHHNWPTKDSEPPLEMGNEHGSELAEDGYALLDCNPKNTLRATPESQQKGKEKTVTVEDVIEENFDS